MRKLAALALAGVFCMTGTALATEPGYYLQLAVGLSPICGPQICLETPCELEGVAGFMTVNVSVIVDCHKGEGFNGVFYGIVDSSGGTTAIHTGAFACPGFLQAPGPAPAQTGWSSTVGCQDCCTAVGYHSYLMLAAVPTSWNLVPHGAIPGPAGQPFVLDCNNIEVDAFCEGPAAVNSGLGIECQCNGPTATEETSWGSLKSLYN